MTATPPTVPIAPFAEAVRTLPVRVFEGSAAAVAARAASRRFSASALAVQLVTAAALSGEVAVAASSYTAIPGQT